MEEMKLPKINQEKINLIKKKSLAKIKNDEGAMQFINFYHISDQTIMDNSSKFLTYIEDRDICKNCQGIQKCKKLFGKIKVDLLYDGEFIDFRYYSCEHVLKEKRIKDSYIIRQFPDEFLNVTLEDVAKIDLNSRKLSLSFLNQLAKSIKKNKSIKNENGLYLYGNKRIGKSIIVASFLNSLYEDKVGPIAYINTASYIKELSDLQFINKEEFENKLNQLFDVPILVLDDFGNEYKSDFVRDTILFPLINERCNNQLLTIFISNYSLEDIETMYSTSYANAPKANQLIQMIKAIAKVIHLDGAPYKF